MSLKQWAGTMASIATLAAFALGTWIAHVRAAPARPGAAQMVSANEASIVVTVPAVIATASGVVSDTVYRWPGTIAAVDSTGNLRSDLGWVNPKMGAPLHVIYCDVATRVSPTPFGRVLTAPNSPIVGRAAYVWTDCRRAFRQWDSLEAKTNGKWPAGL